jgi:lysophospholipase L1-like esterase
MAPKFRGAEERCAGMPEAYIEVASNLRCHYFDANTVTSSSKVDGVHLDADQHLTLGAAVADFVQPILAAN